MDAALIETAHAQYLHYSFLASLLKAKKANPLIGAAYKLNEAEIAGSLRQACQLLDLYNSEFFGPAARH